MKNKPTKKKKKKKIARNRAVKCLCFSHKVKVGSKIHNTRCAGGTGHDETALMF
jgi:hypothetical protein